MPENEAQEQVKDSIRELLDDDLVRVRELTYRDLSHDHTNVEIVIVLEKDEESTI